VESREGIAAYNGENVYLAPPLAWNWPTDPNDPCVHVNTWRQNVHAQKEAQHQDAWQQRQGNAKTAAARDRIHYYQCDHLGTPLELLDAQGEAVWSAQYKAWGGILRYERLEVEQPLRFQGQYEDSETGLYYNRHRYYDPDSARYVTQDPIGLLGGANSYQYAPNPVGWADPLGLARKKGGCDPCCGKNPAAEAAATQGSGDYPNKDSYINMVLKKGTILYSLSPGKPPGFAVTNHTLIKAGGDPVKYGHLTQVIPGTDPKTGLPRSIRSKVKVYRVNEDICVGKGKALAQDPTTHGSGGATQYYVSSSDLGKLSPTGKERPL